MFTDDDLLPVSALQHYVFCPRRAALVHVERLWAENRFTAEGHVLHRRTHDPRRGESRPDVRITRGLELRSYRYGLTGKADVVEFHEGDGCRPADVVIVEYKRGKPKPGRNEEFRVQLCGQALCLEEMLGLALARGMIFFGQPRRRTEIAFDEALRQQTVQTIQELHEMIRSGRTPPARFASKCRRCSLVNLCLPKAMRPRATAARYLSNVIAEGDPTGNA